MVLSGRRGVGSRGDIEGLALGTVKVSRRAGGQMIWALLTKYRKCSGRCWKVSS